MAILHSILRNRWVPAINSFLFFMSCYYTLKHNNVDKMIPYVLTTVLIAMVLSAYGPVNKLGRPYLRLAFLPIIAILILTILVATGLIWWILGLFGVFGYQPN